MALATRYLFQFHTISGRDVAIRIDEDGYTGSVLERNLGGSPTLRMDQNNCIQGTSLEIPAECIVEDEFADLYTSDPYKFYVTVTVDGTTTWRGFITPELYSAPWIDPPYDVTLTATDGLGELKMHTYARLGRQTLEALLSTMLGATGLSMPLKFVSTLEGQGYNALGERTMDVAPEDIISDLSIDLDYMEGSTYYDVLQAILTSLHATIRQYAGVWLLIRETDVEDTMTGSPLIVYDTSGTPYNVKEFGSMRSYPIWPVGKLNMEIVPAKNRVKVSSQNHYIDNFFTDPDMAAGTWGGDGTHYDSDGGCYGLEVGQHIEQDVTFPSNDSGTFVGDLDLTIRARQNDPAEPHDMLVEVIAQGLEPNTQISKTYCLVESYNNPGMYTWAVGTGPATAFEIPAGVNNNSSDCKDYSLRIPFRNLCSYFLSYPPTRFTVKIHNTDAATVFIHSAKLAATAGYDGMDTTVILGNGARGSAGTVEPCFADTYWTNHELLTFMQNSVFASWAPYRLVLNYLRSTALYSFCPTGEFLAKDYALSVANPRLRMKGKLNETVFPAVFYETDQVYFISESWSYDMIQEETDVSMISLPASSLQVVSVRETAWGEGGETDVSAVSVTPASFNIAKDDISFYYIAVNAGAGTSWEVTGIPEWLTFSETSGTGYATISFFARANSGSARSATVLIGGVPVNVNQAGTGTDYTLTISVTPADATIALTVNGTTTAYTAGMSVTPGATVGITVSKTGYITVTDSFTMPEASVEKVYNLSQELWASASWPGKVTAAAQNVPVTISDPAGHGWILSWQQESYRGYITGGSITSGNATLYSTSIAGTGDAVVNLAVSANTGGQRVVGADPAPIYFWDAVQGSAYKDYVEFYQLADGGDVTRVTSVGLNKNSMSKNVGESEKLTATVLPNDATNKTLAWTSSNSSIASVDQDGTVHALGAGTATITASATDGSGKYATCSVTVTGTTVSVTGVTLNTNSLALNVGGESTLSATVAPSNATNKAVTWSSSNTSVATVSSTGKVTAVGAGSATITVTTSDGGYTATCAVTVTASTQGSMSAENIATNSQATSASSRLTVQNMNTASLTASCPATWISNLNVDTSGSVIYVRFDLQTNDQTIAREATVTVTGTATGGGTVTCTFRVTQNARTPSDLPCQSMGITGPDDILNSQNESQYTATYVPQLTTQDACTWTLTDASGNSVAGRVNMLVQGNYVSLTVVDSTIGNQGLALKLKVSNYYNASVNHTKNITAYYVAPASGGHIDVSETYIEVPAEATFDDTAIVTLVNMQTPLTSLQATVTGFITSASVDQYGHVNLAFAANTNTTARNGSVTLTGTNTDNQTVTAIISYLQRGKAGTAYGFEIMALQVIGTTQAKFAVDFFNESSGSKVVRSMVYTLVGYNSQSVEKLRATGTLTDRTVAALSTEEEIYTISIEPSGVTTTYTLTITSDVMTDTFEGDGDDPI